MTLYIDCPPETYFSALARHAWGDLNHIYKEVIEQTGNSIRELNEKNLNRISKGHEKNGYAIISASRGDLLEQEKNKRTNELKRKLKEKGYSYLSVYGGYKELGQDKASMEKSFVVYPYNINRNEALDFNEFSNYIKKLGEEFDQDSVLICEPEGKPKYVALKKDVEEIGFDDVGYNNEENMLFTAIKKWSDGSLNRKNKDWKEGKPQRFSFK